MRYYIADCHFFHAKLNEQMDRRGFDDVDSMNEYMVKQWNEKVRRNDEVVILGDFSWGRAAETEEILQRLQGKKYLITGNHDHFLKEKDFDASRYFEWVLPYKELKDNHRRVILCHYPIMCYNHQYYRNEENAASAYMLHGHVHATQDQDYIDAYQAFVRQQKHTRIDGSQENTPCQIINCFCGFSNYMPMTLDEWIEIDKNRDKKNLRML
ncbi:MAG: metallophosphoesterase family protein [Erysipelotrichaceae bacterium]|nr:metallophosphoesterase family protein [Erysipelotrichaceae bacterium]